MLINVCFDEYFNDVDVIDIPDEIGKNIENLQNEFLEWLFDKTNDHQYWVYDNGVKKYCAYRSGAFVEWLNMHSKNSTAPKAQTVQTNAENIDWDLPVIYF